MSRKRRERRQQAVDAKVPAPAKSPAATDAIRRRRNRRFLFLGVVALSFPILEAIAYQFRAITISVVNRSNVAVKGLKVLYSGGEFDADQLKPGGSVTRVVRPNFTFKSEQFSNYTMSIRFASEDGQIIGQIGRAGALDFSAQEIYTIVQTPPEGKIQLQHATRPGFPLSLVRDLMDRLGFG